MFQSRRLKCANVKLKLAEDVLTSRTLEAKICSELVNVHKARLELSEVLAVSNPENGYGEIPEITACLVASEKYSEAVSSQCLHALQVIENMRLLVREYSAPAIEVLCFYIEKGTWKASYEHDLKRSTKKALNELKGVIINWYRKYSPSNEEPCGADVIAWEVSVLKESASDLSWWNRRQPDEGPLLDLRDNGYVEVSWQNDECMLSTDCEDEDM